MIEARGCRYVTERPVATVAKKKIRRAVLRVVVGHGEAVLVQSLVVAVKAEINVQPAVAVVIAESSARKGALGSLSEAESIRLQPKSSPGVITKQQRAGGTDHDQVLVPVVVYIGEQRTGSVVQHPHAGCFGHVFEGPIAPIPVKAVGQAGRLANVEVIEPVVVNVACRDPVVSINIDPAGAVQHRTPVVCPAK